MYPSNDPIVGPMVDNNDNPIVNSPNFNKPFFSSKNTFRKGSKINAMIIPRNTCDKICYCMGIYNLPKIPYNIRFLFHK